MKKVFCEECKYFKTNSNIPITCNKQRHVTDTPIKRNGCIFYFHPNVDNKKNYCKGYEQKKYEKTFNIVFWMFIFYIIIISLIVLIIYVRG